MFLTIFTVFILISSEILTLSLDQNIFPIFKKKLVLLQKNIYILIMEYFLVLKHSTLIGYCEVAKTYTWPFFGVVLYHPFYSEPLLQNIMIRYKNDSNGANVSSVKTQCKKLTYKLTIGRNL